jgi:2-keto-4-pentenoate hydratase/2-oxohepta-3-ene-1,7-dioic acid hydratase in catechol pathway
MRIVVYGDDRRLGAVRGDDVVDLNRASARRIPPSLLAFIEGGPAALEAAQRAIERPPAVDRSVVLPLDRVRLHAPWPGRRIACAGGNYADHLQGMEAHRAEGPPPSLDAITRAARERGQWGFWKVPHRVAGPDETIQYPRRTRCLDYEGEVAIVIGKSGKDIPADRLDEYVWGVTLFQDWSIRDGMGASRPMSYNQAKNFDDSTSLGPCISVGELDPGDIDVENRVDSDVRQRFNTRDMIFSFGEILEFLSRDFTFVPGDVIAGGTAAGTAADTSPPNAHGIRSPDRFLTPGSVVELLSPDIGSLRNRIVSA